MISTMTILVLATPVLVRTLVMAGRLGTAAASAGGITPTPTVVAAIRRKFSKGGALDD